MDEELVNKFSLRQTQVARRVCKGMTNAEIAVEMGLSEKTVKAHLTMMYKIAGCKNRTSLALQLKNIGGLRPESEDAQRAPPKVPPKTEAERWLAEITSNKWTRIKAAEMADWLVDGPRNAVEFIDVLRREIASGGTDGWPDESGSGEESEPKGTQGEESCTGQEGPASAAATA